VLPSWLGTPSKWKVQPAERWCPSHQSQLTRQLHWCYPYQHRAQTSVHSWRTVKGTVKVNAEQEHHSDLTKEPFTIPHSAGMQAQWHEAAPQRRRAHQGGPSPAAGPMKGLCRAAPPHLQPQVQPKSASSTRMARSAAAAVGTTAAERWPLLLSVDSCAGGASCQTCTSRTCCAVATSEEEGVAKAAVGGRQRTTGHNCASF
jgi:hypothetical protein